MTGSDASTADATDDADAPPTGDDAAPGPEYSDMLDTLDVALAECQRKIEDGRVYDAENEKVRIKWIKALAYTMNVRRQVANDAELADLAERVESIENSQPGGGHL